MCVCALLSLSPLTNIPGFDHWFLPWWPHLILSPLKGPASKYYMRIKCQHLEPTLTPCQNLGRLYINQGSPKDRAFVCISVPMYTRGKKRSVLKSLDHTVLKTGKCKLCWVDQEWKFRKSWCSSGSTALCYQNSTWFQGRKSVLWEPSTDQIQPLPPRPCTEASVSEPAIVNVNLI